MLRRFFIAALLLVASTASADRRLDWRSLDVVAHLERDGTMHIVEKQVIRFTGDWNGGERMFHLNYGETLDFHGIARVREDGVQIPLDRGDLDRVDNYSFTNPTTLRWRSRLPSDPPFDHTEITYVLDYSIANVVRVASGSAASPREANYLLDEDFAFAERVGYIEHYLLDLTFDPAWQPVTRVERFDKVDELAPGKGFVLRIPLRYAGGAAPSSVIFGTPAAIRIGALGILAAGLLVLFIQLLLRQAAMGQLAPLPREDAIDEAWLDENVFKLPPEVIGAAWDAKTGAAEVAAVLARMQQEGKIESRVDKGGFFRKDVLHLKLKVDQDSLPPGEKALAKSLFFDDGETDTESIRDHYRGRGFDPSSKIRPTIDARLRERTPWKDRKIPRKWLWRLALLGVAVILLVVAGRQSRNDLVPVMAVGFTGLFVLIFGRIWGFVTRDRVTGMWWTWIAILAPEILLAGLITGFAMFGWLQIAPFTYAALVFYALVVFSFLTEGAETRQTAEKIEFRKKLVAARRYFQRQLHLREPQLKDAWFPYLLAFGLGSNVDRWFRSFGDSNAASSFGSTTASSSWSGGSSSSGWTGGGGAFGGAGASGSWAVAAGSLASGVAAPSSSSGGGGGGGGGGSSGGGGGGGW